MPAAFFPYDNSKDFVPKNVGLRGETSRAGLLRHVESKF